MESIGRYKVLERLGEGGMAEVFRARLDGPMGFQKDLAIKRIRDSVVKKDEEHARSLINEARIGGRLKHPNVVEVYELGEDEGSYYIAMELVDGLSLRELLGTKTRVGPKIPANVLLDIMIQICRGLAYAHSYETEEGERLPVVHRDVKPSNIMVTRDGSVKLMDFGIAKSEGNLFHTTATGIAKGTPLYMSPEQLRGMRPLPAASDLFSLGAILFEMVTGELLFAGSSIPEIINRVLYQPLQADIHLAEEELSGIGDILRRLLERDVAHREQDAAVVALELSHLLEWQDKSRSTSKFVRSWIERQKDPEASHSLEMRQLADVAVDSQTLPRPRPPESETFVSLYVTAMRRRRMGYLLLGALFVALTLGAGLYVYRGTLGVLSASTAGFEAMNQGDLLAAEVAWREELGRSPSPAPARYGLAGLATLGTLSENGIEAVEDLLERVPVEGYAEDARRMQALARAHRAGGDYRQASLLLEAAMGRARQAEQADQGSVPASLLWEAGEMSLLRDAAEIEVSSRERALLNRDDRERVDRDREFTARARRERARSYFAELRSTQGPGLITDAADSYVALIDRGGEAIIRTELLWRTGDRERAWAEIASALKAHNASADRQQRERLVWIYRAISEGRYKTAGKLLDALGLLTGEPERRRQAQVARATTLAARGREAEARKRLDAALKATQDDEVAGTSRLLVAIALLRSERSPQWAAALLEEAAIQIGDHHPDLVRVLALQEGSRSEILDPELYPGFGNLGLDPRSGRLFLTGLSRGTPSGGRIAGALAYVELNRTTDGSAWPFGPAFHPVEGTPLQVVFHPDR